MLSRLLRLFRGPSNEPLREILDPVLSRCVPDQVEHCWRASVDVGGREVSIILGGDLTPDPALLAHARQIAGEMGAFVGRVADFLKREAGRIEEPDVQAEIENLLVDDVCLFWPDRPNDGMIYFAGPTEERLWRCDYIERRLQGLGCDT